MRRLRTETILTLQPHRNPLTLQPQHPIKLSVPQHSSVAPQTLNPEALRLLSPLSGRTGAANSSARQRSRWSYSMPHGQAQNPPKRTYFNELGLF